MYHCRYNGARDFNGLKKFVDTTLDVGPACALDSLDDCTPREKEAPAMGAGCGVAADVVTQSCVSPSK